MDNHYHQLGYLKIGTNLGEMMRRMHGSVAKLVNDILPMRKVPFWREGHDTYFDGRLRDELQFRRTYRYVLLQAVRHGIAHDYRDYPHTRVNVELEVALRRALELNAFLKDVPYRHTKSGDARAGANSISDLTLPTTTSASVRVAVHPAACAGSARPCLRRSR
jgi:hypothetical protein